MYEKRLFWGNPKIVLFNMFFSDYPFNIPLKVLRLRFGVGFLSAGFDIGRGARLATRDGESSLHGEIVFRSLALISSLDTSKEYNTHWAHIFLFANILF